MINRFLVSFWCALFLAMFSEYIHELFFSILWVVVAIVNLAMDMRITFSDDE